MMDEGYIKFDCQWVKEQPFCEEDIHKLTLYRDVLSELDLIGVYQSGIGFGNLSTRSKDRSFIITGSATGGLRTLSAKDYSSVIDYDLERNKVVCAGMTKASSESLSHAAVYDSNSSIAAVIHVHDVAMWDTYKGVLPTTHEDVPYGTPEMAYELQKVMGEPHTTTKRIIVMGGHEEGILTFGRSLEEAIDVLMDYYHPVHH